jgi:hypothetical protein
VIASFQEKLQAVIELYTSPRCTHFWAQTPGVSKLWLVKGHVGPRNFLPKAGLVKRCRAQAGLACNFDGAPDATDEESRDWLDERLANRERTAHATHALGRR